MSRLISDESLSLSLHDEESDFKCKSIDKYNLSINSKDNANIFLLSKVNKQKKWTDEEDKLLLSLVPAYNEKNWKEISSFFNKTSIQCYSRYKRIRKGIIKGSWTIDDDDQLLKYYEQYGRNWSFIAKLMKKRNGKQVRDRYLNCLDPEINHDKFSKEEDTTILDSYKVFGANWSFISKKCLGRTGDMVKNRFYSSLTSKYPKRQRKLSRKKESSILKKDDLTLTERVTTEEINIAKTEVEGELSISKIKV